MPADRACIVRRMHARFLQRISFSFAGFIFLAGAAQAAAPAVHKAESVPAVRPLTMLVGGRMLVTPAPGNFGGEDYTSQWPGSYFRAAFAGTKVFFRVGKSDEILHVVVDGQAAGSLVKPEEGVYEVDGLSEAKHEIEVLVATESQAAPNTFGGFAILAGEKAQQPAARRRQIEFIGDSHTVGYGNLSTKHACTKDEIWSDTDDTKAFGALIAAHYDADYQVNAISGRGVVRNYGGFEADTLPEAYPYVLFDKQQRYSDPAWKPQVIVVALGTNDFTTPLHAGERWKTRDELHADYEATYVRFLEGLRARDAGALIIVWATDMAQGEIETEARNVVEQMRQRGDQRITFLPIDGLSLAACDWHPSAADDRVIADKVMRVIDAARVWSRQ